MQYDDLKFTVPDITGREVECEILSLTPINEDESYVVYTNRELDSNANIIFMYGKLIKVGDEYMLKGGLSDEEVEKAKKGFHEDLVDFSHIVLEDK